MKPKPSFCLMSQKQVFGASVHIYAEQTRARAWNVVGGVGGTSTPSLALNEGFSFNNNGKEGFVSDARLLHTWTWKQSAISREPVSHLSPRNSM